MAFRTTQKIGEALDIRTGNVAADGDAGINTGWLAMEGVTRMAFVVQTVDGEDVDDVQIQEAKDDAGDGAQNLGDAFDIDARTGVVEIKGSDLSEGFTHVRATVSTDGEHPVAVIPLATGSYRP